MSIIGTKMPPFTGGAVIENQLGEFTSESLLGKWSVVFFYPLDFTFVCPTEILAFSNAASDFRALGAEVIGISVDSQFSHLAWINTPREKGGLGPLDISLVSDLNKTIARDFDVLDEGPGVAYRGVFIMDPQGIVQSAIVNNLPVGRNVNEVLRTLKAFQFVTENDGLVCPANWNEGDDVMKASPSGVAEYLSSH